MEQILINLVAGALGGVGVGKSSSTFDLGMIGNIISGLIGGGVLGQIVTLLLPAITAAAQSGNLSVEGIISQVIAGEALAAPYSPRSLAQSRTKPLPDGHLPTLLARRVDRCPLFGVKADVQPSVAEQSRFLSSRPNTQFVDLVASFETWPTWKSPTISSPHAAGRCNFKSHLPQPMAPSASLISLSRMVG
jgi:hypothetical protein